MKNALGIVGIIVLGALVIIVGHIAKSYAHSVNQNASRSFTVSADGKAVTVPDVAEFTVSVVTEGSTDVADLQQQNTDKMNAVIDYVKSQGVDAKDIRTESYYVDPRYENRYCPPIPPPLQGQTAPSFSGEGFPKPGGVCPPPGIAGYTITQTILVKARDFKKVGDLLSGVVSHGANLVSSLTFTVDDPSVVQQKAWEEAIAKAKKKAEAMAKAGDFHLGRLLSISESGEAPPPYYGRGFGGDLASAETRPATPPVIEPGSEEVSTQVTLQYEIE